MEIKRNLNNIVVDTMIFIFMTIMMSTVVAFFMNINNDEILVMSIVIPVILSLIVSGIIMRRYYAKFPVNLKVEENIITINKLYMKEKILISDITKISEVNTMEKLTGSVMYKIDYEGNKIVLNSKRYYNLKEFILEIKSKIGI